MAIITTDSLPADVSSYIQSELSTGKYQSAEDLVAVAVRQLRTREQQLAELNAKLDEGLRDVEQGNVIRIRSEEEHRAFFESIQERGRQELRNRHRD